ncbi:MAG: 2-oxoacid:acceptor oxidoreductase family protein [Ignavibacteria bacterium]|nr:2-oxoacid:acceptor oxidoreductase family protein [Ignavibacteria bacterium]
MSTIETELALLDRVGAYDLDLEARTPSYCAGCPHRGTSSVVLDLRAKLNDPVYMRREHGREPVDIVAHGGIGCYSLNFLPPFRDMHNMAAMGLGGAAGLGAYPFTTNKHYVLCGDSTFFHSEMSTLSNAIKDSQDILYIILDNKNTAMTGHQTTPGSAYDVMGYKTIQQDIESVVRGMDRDGRLFIRRVNPADRDSYMALLEDAFLMDGVRVIIADRECAITYHRRKRAAMRERVRSEGFRRIETHINITPEVCENCRECTVATGCPGLTIVNTPYGEKIGIDGSICVDDKYCTKIKACPSFEQVEITRVKAPPAKTGDWDLWLRDLPHPDLPALDAQHRSIFSIFVPGVGGMGLGFVAKILTEAGAKEGYAVNFYHQKGLAQRNGAVVSHILYSVDGTPVSQRIPEGKADLILGLDYLETVRGLALASSERTAVVCNTAQTPTIMMLTGEDRFPDGIEERILRYSRREKYFGADFFHLSEHYFGDRLYANLMMLGSAYQRGLLPVRAASVEAVIRESVRKDERENNLRAFRIGRRLVTHPEMLLEPASADTLASVLADKRATLRRERRRYAGHFDTRMRACAEVMPRLPEDALRDFARRYADLLVFQDNRYAERYAEAVLKVYEKETGTARTDPSPFAATAAVIWNLAKVMAIKDEIWVASLLTSDEKLRADRARYDVDPARGDRIRYLHINRPRFDVFGTSVEWDMQTRNWMLLAMKRMRWLRRLLPRWHAREKAFRDWYLTEVIGAYLRDDFASTTDALTALRVPMTCTGYREIVYPKHDRARAAVAELLRAAGRG